MTAVPAELLALVPLLLVAVIAAANLTVLAITLLNVATFPRLRSARPGVPADAVAALVGGTSVCIPARNEAASIGATVLDLLRQSPPPLEVLVLDDGSTDGTADAARDADARARSEAAPGAGRLRVLEGEPLPSGWAGKPWACEQLGSAAAGARLLFTDADTRWAPGGLAALAAEAVATDADLLTAWPTQETVTWGERLTVPLMAFAVLGYLPAVVVHGLPIPLAAAANGQCLLFRREAYRAIGGHTVVAREVLDDVGLGRRIKAVGRRLRMVDGAGFVGCRMYADWPSARDGFGKNIMAGYGGSLAGLAAATLFHWLVFLGPWVWLALGWALPVATGSAAGGATAGAPEPLAGSWPLLPLGLAAVGVVARGLTAAATRQRVRDALLMPVSVVLMTLVAARAASWARSGGVRWKGRVLPADRS